MFFHITADERMHDILIHKNNRNKKNVMNAWDWIFLHYGPYLDIEDENSLDSYLNWLDKFYEPQISPHRKENSYSDIWKNTFQSINKKLKQILKQSDIKVIIWMEENSRSNPLLLCYLATLSDCKNVYLIDENQVKNNIFKGQKKSAYFEYDWCENSLNEAVEMSIKVSQELVLTYRQLWKNIWVTPDLMRVYAKGKLTNEKLSYYDEKILDCLKFEMQKVPIKNPKLNLVSQPKKLHEYVPLGDVYGSVMRKYFLGDIAIINRLIYLIDTGKINYKVYGDYNVHTTSLYHQMLDNYWITLN